MGAARRPFLSNVGLQQGCIGARQVSKPVPALADQHASTVTSTSEHSAEPNHSSSPMSASPAKKQNRTEAGPARSERVRAKHSITSPLKDEHTKSSQLQFDQCRLGREPCFLAILSSLWHVAPQNIPASRAVVTATRPPARRNRVSIHLCPACYSYGQAGREWTLPISSCTRGVALVGRVPSCVRPRSWLTCSAQLLVCSCQWPVIAGMTLAANWRLEQ